MNEIDTPLARLIRKKRRQNLPISEMRSVITTDYKDIERIIERCYEWFYVNKFNNLYKMDNFLEGCK